MDSIKLDKKNIDQKGYALHDDLIMYEMIMGGMEGATKANNEIVTVTRDSMI